ncbi:MAG: FmdB family zinc ribbon protein [Burkholderiales bacterium]
MPIYAYKCASCGLAKDVLQKMSDSPIERCPACGEPTFIKQVTAAGFQLKGSGWYATDFKSQPKAAGGASAKDDATDSKRSEANGDSGKSEGISEGKSDDKPAAKSEVKGEGTSPPAPAPAASPAPAPPPKPSGSKPPAGG